VTKYVELHVYVWDSMGNNIRYVVYTPSAHTCVLVVSRRRQQSRRMPDTHDHFTIIYFTGS